MNRWIIPLLSIALAVAAQAQSIKTFTAKNVDLAQFETFTVLKGESVTRPDQKVTSDQALFEAIRKAVRAEMEGRGYKYVDDSTAQLHVSYVAGSFDFTDAGNVGPLGETPASDPSGINQSRSYSNTTREGLLMLDIVDGITKKELWKAETQDMPLSRADPARVLDATIYKAFRKFPGKGSKKKRK